MIRILFVICLLVSLTSASTAKIRVYNAADYGLKADSKKNATLLLNKALLKIKSECAPTDSIVLRFAPGTYQFHEKGAALRTYYISNHDQSNPKKVAFALEDFHHFTLDGNGASFVFHGRMLPIALLRSEQCTLKDFSIDFANPHIAQIKIIENKGDRGLVFEPAPWVQYRITPDSLFQYYGDNWSACSSTGIAFDGATRHMVYQTSDLTFTTQGARDLGDRRVYTPRWKDARLVPGTIVAMRSWGRPAPGIFLSHNLNTTLQNIKVHYAEGMGLLAQLCENIRLDGFSVCLKGNQDPRYFTSQADATHFSGCKGTIVSTNGLYEGMMDDAINVHGTYLKVVKRIDERTLVGRYMHDQSWGFEWGRPGDRVQFIRSATMDLVGTENRISTIVPYDRTEVDGAREFLITFEHPVDASIVEVQGFGIENLTWTPKVIFAHNIVRNNRARGALFSTPQDVLVEENLFDHTSGTAILLCGDCNGWYETGACRKVVIRKNRFINALTNMFQFTNAIISIYPEIPHLEKQQSYFHGGKYGGILIERNIFETFDAPILYAKSVDGLIYRDNEIKQNHEYRPFHWNKNRFLLEHVTNVQIME